MPKVDLSIIIPCYNEGPTFTKSVGKIVQELKNMNLEWEIIFVEDKSTDDTPKLVEKLVKKHKNSRSIFHKKNEGRGKSVSDGVKAAKGPICGYLDVDLEISPSYIPLFVKEIEKGNDLVMGKRFYEGGGLNSILRFLASKIYAIFVKYIVDIPIEDTEAGYKFFRRTKILPILTKVKSKHWFWDTEICALAHWSGLSITQVPVLFKRRYDKKSTVKLIPDTIDYIKNLIRLKSKLKNQNAKLQFKI